MQAWKILVVEDQIAIAMDIQSELQDMGFQNVEVYHDGESVIKDIKGGKRMPDLAILDINLGKKQKTGIQLAQFLNSKKIIPIIYLTGEATDKNFQDALETYPEQFLEKPFNSRKLKRSIDLAMATHQNPQRLKPVEYIFVKKRLDAYGKKVEKIYTATILWVMASHGYVDLYTESGVHKGIENLLADFNDAVKFPHFFQVHRSYIINTDKIDSIDLGYKFVKIDDTRIPISDSFREAVKKRIPFI